MRLLKGLLALALGRLERLERFAAADAVRNAHVVAGCAGDVGNLPPQDEPVKVDALASEVRLAVLHAELRDDGGHKLGLHVLEPAPLHTDATSARGLGEIGRRLTALRVELRAEVVDVVRLGPRVDDVEARLVGDGLVRCRMRRRDEHLDARVPTPGNVSSNAAMSSSRPSTASMS